MGNRARIIFHDKYTISPSVYLHWHADAVPGLITQLSTLMQGRHGDAGYAAARFTGLCHNLIPGNLSLGIEQNKLRRTQLCRPEDLAEFSPGDAGLVLVDTDDFSWKAFAGYLAS